MVELAILDVNGTLFSLDVLAERLEGVGLGGSLQLWFTRILRDGFAASAAGTFVAFPDLARHHLERLLDESDQPLETERVDHVIDGFTDVVAHDDVEAGLRALRDAGVTTVTMTNGTAEITDAFLEREGLDGLVDATYDVEMAGRWKPAPEPYRYALERHGVAPERAALIAVHPWDIHGAVQLGLVGVWVDRTGHRYPGAFHPPQVRAGSFEAAVDELLSR